LTGPLIAAAPETILAVMRRYRFDPAALTSWDEVLWLMFLARGFRLAHMAMA
jgi:hypothetical protein